MSARPHTLRNDLINELQYISSLGSKICLCPADEKQNKKVGYYIITSLVLFTSLQLFFTLTLTGFNDWMEIINVAPNIGVCVMSTIKYTKIRTNKILYGKMFSHFGENIWYIIDECPGENAKIATRYLAIAKFINRFMVYYSLPLIIVVDSFPWLIMNYEHKILGKEIKYLYPFDAWYPFDKIKWYYAAYIWESFMTGMVIWIYAFANIINITFIVFICMELRLVGNCIANLISNYDAKSISKQHNLSKIHENIRRKLRVIIKRHEFLMNTSSELDIALGDIMILSYTFGAVFICLTAFSFTVVDDLFQSLRYFSVFISLICEVFDQCIIGQVLSDHSEKLAEAIYSCNWTVAEPKTKKVLLMFLMRTQKPFKLTAHGYLTMNLNTFCKICSSSYQFFNLLRTIYDE